MARLKRKKLQIAKAHPPGQPGPPNPEPSSPYLPGKSPHKIAHGKFFDDDGRITKQDPSVGLTPSGKKIKMKVDKEKQKKNKAKHDRLYHGGK